IRQRFEKAVARLGIGVRSGRFKTLDTSRFRPPSATSTVAQMMTPARAAAQGRNRNGKNTGDQFELF
ncbi:MAG: radical SAM protein, partial [Nitrosospira sp.]